MPDPSMKCPNCSFVGKSPQSLRVHMAIAHKAGPAKYKRPVGDMGGGRGTTCQVCGKTLKTPAAHKAHMTRMHRGGRSGAKAGPASKLQRNLMTLSLGELAELYETCRKDLQRRLVELLGKDLS